MDFRRVLPEATIYVYDNNSTDGTAELARTAGAVVRHEYQQGKGNVIRRMFREIDAEAYIMVDGDDTYPAEAAPEMVKAVTEHQADMVVGDRLSSTYYTQNKRPFHNFGNDLVRFFTNNLFGGQIKDIMTGYRAFSYQFVKTYPVLSRGFEIETEMTIHALHRNMQVENVIIDYRDRPAGSESKLNTYSDGFRVLRTIARLYKNYRPFGFFSTLAAVLGIISLCFLAPVLGEYFATGLVPRFPTLIVCACVLVAALLLFISGVILSSQLTKDDRDFEFHLQQVQQWKNRSADPFSHSAKKQYDYLIVGAGLFGAVFAQQATKAGKSCLVIDKRDHIAGNIYTENVEGINVHRYGAHIFHTNNKEVWDYVNQFAVFNRYTNSPVANYKGELYNLPFNMNTFNKMWGVVTPAEAEAKIEEQRAAHFTAEPKNLEEQAINLVGTDIYEKLVKHYTEKQWGRPCTELPAFIIKRLPVRLIFDNNYFNALYQGIPNGGYTQMVANMLQGVEVRLGVNYLANKAELDALADRVIYTGPIDAYFDYSLGTLQYRSVRFETETLACPNYQGNAVINYTDAETPYTRIIEHKHFEFGSTEPGTKTVISREYSAEWKPGDEPYYPVNDDKNSALYAKYKALADAEPHVVFGGRLGEYKYYDMDKVIESALACVAVQMDKINQYKA